MNITKDRVVSINYTLTNDQNQVLDSTGDGPAAEPFLYLHGHQNIVPGLERALEGKEAGDSFKISVSAADAYGERNDKFITTVPLDRFSGADKVEEGMQFHAETPEGELQMITVTKVDGKNVTIDANHPMAGQNLNFAVSVVDVREANEEELQHGHVHSHSHEGCDEGDCADCHDCG
ncbi:peptidyl-prolyl cis-trans isomerase [Spirochaetia bacterium]|nr:peptidyl-prolyl cis-trans isomerase [Spirochaetia bacterium]